MPRRSKSTPEIEDLVRKRHAEGRSTYEIEEEIGIPHQTISKWQRKWGLKANTAKGPRATRARPTRQVDAVASPPPEVAAFPEPQEALTGDIDPLEDLRRVDGQIRTAMETAYRDIARNSSSLSTYEKLAALRLKYASAIREMTPKNVVDPEKDPTNIEAADALTATIARLVDRAERTARCAHCGKAPFTP